VYYMSNKVTVVIDNTHNSLANNPPGFIHRIGVLSNTYSDDGVAEVGKEYDNHRIRIIVDSDTKQLPVWYNEYGWNSTDRLHGPFKEGETVVLPKVIPLIAYK